ncbi:AbrB family transcriptional regulator [Nocardioides sp. zg-1228]|uniref:AbrB family transcriptional regulator n=1 Tax=Nocardioides sp. zg-1228 TaxID=2763008 RepID=UPI0016433B5C|nr:AbrB family transcriptional regulator [Nocardioides sp. zg-1228]MBC2931973.1 AbrB family transcriptional regulator [Nocardioides sp. zg-1228]QSF57529.1 AbrB family transcriptional regulator [Nocardioides sp. zg-1228]
MIASILATSAAALVGAGVATALKLPAAPLLGAMIGVAALSLSSELSWQAPGGAKWVVYVAIGALLGQSVTRESLVALRSAAVPIVITVVLFLLFGLALAWGLWRFTDFDVHTALLSTAPGGIAQMGALSAEANANVPVVLSIHVLRITSVIVLMSLGLKLMGGRS